MSDLGVELRGLYDVARIRRDLGISRSVAETIMRQLPKQRTPPARKVYVRALDLQRWLDKHREDA